MSSKKLEADRKNLVDQIMKEVPSGPVAEAFASIPREAFVPQSQVEFAYEDHPLPIGHGQTISQPSLVAHMTALLELNGSEKVLEIGTGCGYQTALLAKLAKDVFTIERIPELQQSALRTLSRLGIKNVHFLMGNGRKGWREHAPYDAIITTAAAEEIPQPLQDQLSERGRILIPVGGPRSQELILATKIKGCLQRKRIYDVRFVPLLDSEYAPHQEI